MKRVFSLFLCLCVIVNVFCLTAYANEEELVTEFYESGYMDFSQTNDFNSGYAALFYYKNDFGKQVYSSYSTLSDIEKEFYDSVVNLPVGTMSFTVDYSPALSKAEFESINFNKIMNAICLDHPEIFYYNGYRVGKSYYPSTGAVTKIIYNIGVKKHGQTNADIYTTANIPSYSQALNDAFSRVQVDTSNRFSFVKSVHDYLCNSITYVNDYASCHDVYGALVNKEAVCQGYAEAMKMFCDYYKIPCVCLTGTGNGGAHMWNAVQMDDGKWYLIDATWDDQESDGIYNDFFLVGLNTKDVYFTRSEFCVSHISDGNLYLPSLNYSLVKYSETNHDTAFNATYNSIAKNGNYLVRSFFDSNDTLVYYNGMKVDADSLTTNQSFTVPSGSNNAEENWTMVLVGDCNGDSSCNVLDLSDVVNKVLSDAQVDNAYNMAADADCDGYLDVIDIAIIERAVSGSNTNIIIE